MQRFLNYRNQAMRGAADETRPVIGSSSHFLCASCNRESFKIAGGVRGEKSPYKFALALCTRCVVRMERDPAFQRDVIMQAGHVAQVNVVYRAAGLLDVTPDVLFSALKEGRKAVNLFTYVDEKLGLELGSVDAAFKFARSS